MKRVFLVIGFVFFLCALLLAFRKDHKLTPTEAKEKIATDFSNYVQWKDGLIHYTDKGKGTPILFIHGYAGSFHNWEKLIDVFPEGYRLIAIDLPGFGLSDFPSDVDSNVQYVDLYTEFTDYFINKLELDSVYIVGNSLGGYVAWETALRSNKKVKKLALLNAVGYNLEDLQSFLAKLMERKSIELILRNGVPKVLTKEAFARCLGDRSKMDENRMEVSYCLINKVGTLETIRQIAMSGQQPDSNRISLINQPTLILWGDKDRVVPVEHAYKFERDIPNNKLIIYEGSGHIPMIENTDETLNDLLHFFGHNNVAI